MPTLLILGSKPDPALPPAASFDAVACANASGYSADRHGLPVPALTAISAVLTRASGPASRAWSSGLHRGALPRAATRQAPETVEENKNPAGRHQDLAGFSGSASDRRITAGTASSSHDAAFYQELIGAVPAGPRDHGAGGGKTVYRVITLLLGMSSAAMTATS
jgi:hypothetical protein